MGLRLYRHLEYERDGFLISFILVSTAAAGLVPPILAILTGRVFNLLDHKEKDNGFNPLSRPMAIMALGAASLPAVWANISAWMLLGERCAFGVRRKLLSKYFGNSFEWYDRAEDISGNFTQQNRCVEEVRASCAEASALLTRNMVTIVALIGTSFYFSWSLTLVTLCSAPIIIAFGWVFSRMVQKYADLENKATSKASELVNWSITAAQFIRLSGTELKEIKNFKNCAQSCTDNFLKVCLYSSLNMATLRFLSLAMFVQAFWFGATMIRKGRLNVGDVITCFHSCILLGSTISGTLHQLVVLQKGTVAVNRISEFLEDDQLTSNQDSPRDGVRLYNFQGDIKFRNIQFCYPSRSNQLVLKSICLNFRAGETTFLLGKSGSGKSSLANLLLKFYGNYQGTITIDGKDIRDVSQNQLVGNITVVEQRCTMFNGTLRENIIIGATCENEEEIYRKLKIACRISLLENFIYDLSNGLDTLIGNGGILLSGGQQQKVAIARALMKDPSILILDESLSALDKLQRGLILKAIRTQRKGKTNIVMTHQLSDIDSADYCYLMEDGRCIEQGFEGALSGDISSKFYSWKHMHEQSDYSDLSSHFTSVESPVTPEKFAAESIVDFEVETPRLESNSRTIFSDDETVYTLSHSKRARAKRERVVISEKACGVSETPINTGKKQLTIFSILKLMFRSSKKKPFLSLGILSSLAAGAANPVFSYTFSHLFNGLVPQADGVGSQPYLLKWSLIVIGVAAADSTLNFLQYFFLGYCSEYWIFQLRNKIMQTVTFEKLDWFFKETHKAPEISALLLNDARDLRALASDFLVAISSFSVVSLVGILWSLAIGWKLSLVCISMFPLIVLFSAVYGKVLQKQETQYKSAVADVENLLYEVTTGMKTIRRLQLENHFLRKYKQLENAIRVVASRRAITTGLGVALIEALAMCIQAVLFYYAIQLVFRGEYTTKTMLETLTLLLFTIMTCNMLMSQIPDISRGQRAADRIYCILSESKHRGDTEHIQEQPSPHSVDKSQSLVSLRGLSFAYPNAPYVNILDGLDLELEAGKSFALVGQSGSGKSTLVTLLTKLHQATAGTIFVEKKAITDWNTRELRDQISVVEQKPIVFPGSIRENLVYGISREILDIEIYDVLRCVGIHDFLAQLKLGLDTTVDIDLLSGGQLQRLCIARALLKRPKILILDECTSALDPSSSSVINNIVRNGYPALLTISITHNVDMMKACSEIVVLKNGRVAGKGTFDRLLEHNKIFRALIADGE